MSWVFHAEQPPHLQGLTRFTIVAEVAGSAVIENYSPGGFGTFSDEVAEMLAGFNRALDDKLKELEART